MPIYCGFYEVDAFTRRAIIKNEQTTKREKITWDKQRTEAPTANECNGQSPGRQRIQ